MKADFDFDKKNILNSEYHEKLIFKCFSIVTLRSYKSNFIIELKFKFCEFIIDVKFELIKMKYF